VNTVSSCTEPKASPNLLEVIEALLVRGRDEEAWDIQVNAAYTAIIYNIEDVETLLNMPVDEYAEKYAEPPRLTIPQPLGWDKVYYGDAAFEKRGDA